MHFRLFSCCFLVSGAKRSLITDVQRNTFFLIPNSLYTILIEEKEHSLFEILEKNGLENRETIEEYFSFLAANELIFWCQPDELTLFPDIPLHYENPAQITNAIIDLDEQSSHDFGLIFNELESLGCQNLQVRCYTERPLQYIDSLLKQAENSQILSIELIMKATDETTQARLEALWNQYPRLQQIVIHSTPEQSGQVLDQSKTASIFFTSQKIDNESHCGQIGVSNFNIHLNTFTESQSHNTCLNRKISIDVKGYIKNCPSLAKSYGQIGQISLTEVLSTPGFSDLWYVHKGQIKVCQDCEFRHICTDCRAYIQEIHDPFSKPAKCSYDPYTMTWGVDNSTHNPLYGR